MTVLHGRNGAVLADPAAAIADAGLTEAERAMLLAGDVHGLYGLVQLPRAHPPGGVAAVLVTAAAA